MKRVHNSTEISCNAVTAVLHGTSLEASLYSLTPTDANADYMDFVIRIHDKRIASSAVLGMEIQYQGKRILVDNPFEIDAVCESFVLMDVEYRIYFTHVLALEQDSLRSIYFQLKRVSDVKVEIVLDMGLDWFPSEFPNGRFTRARFFPPDVDPTKYGLKIDMRQVPQRGARWFSAIGSLQVRGSNASKYLGFFVPSKANEPQWSIDQPITDHDALVRVRKGSSNEDYGLIMYLHANPTCSVSLIGRCDAPSPYPIGWGASPDALVTDSASAQPQGVLEIKTTDGTLLTIEAHFIPQMYMEMIATSTTWCDLLRMRSAHTAEGTSRRGRIYRLKRHAPTEALMTRLIKYAHSNKLRLQEVILEHEFVTFRAFLNELCIQLPYRDIEVTPEMEDSFIMYGDTLARGTGLID